MIRVAIIGCGQIASNHIESLCDFADVEITALCSRNRANAEEKKSEITEATKGRVSASGIEVFADYADLIERATIDAVDICTPPCAHMEPTIAAANAGKHVYCEGPIAGDLREADAMITAARGNNIRFTVQFGSRFAPAAHKAKRAIDAGMLGKIMMGKVDILWHRPQAYFDSAEWRGTWKGERGGAAFHHGRYAIDLLLWLMGDVEDVYAVTDTFAHDIEIEDCCMATCRFKSGAMGQITASTAAHPGVAPVQRLEMFGDRAAMAVAPEWKIGSCDTEYAESIGQELESKAWGPDGGAKGQLRDFIDAIREDRTPFVAPESSRAQVELARAIYKSAAKGVVVQLPLLENDPFYGGEDAK
ncbi:MAG: Gfo/Idh/MocA family oxidoreductase [Lentisphaerae bacterium]|nr:Gfo/Idh/MocA family oxidoreductase [Lentisphaerota bacterium]